MSEIYFESVLKTGAATITGIETREDNITYFKANGHDYACVNDRVFHVDSPTIVMLTHLAKKNTPEGVIAEHASNEEFNENWDKFMDYEEEIFGICMDKVMNIMLSVDDREKRLEKAKRILEHYYDHLLPGPGCDAFIKTKK